jgi:hypothetical protein
MGIDAIVSLVSLFGPKLINLVGGIFGRKNTPEQTLASLAQANPDALGKYVEAQAALVRANNESVNADISGSISVWVANTRAMIRPVITVAAAAHTIYSGLHGINLDESTRYTYEVIIGSWFGSRLSR